MDDARDDEGDAGPALSEDEALFRSLLDGTFEGILIHDDVIHYANSAAARMMGRRRNDLIGVPMTELGTAPEKDDDVLASRRPTEGLFYGPIRLVVRPGGPTARVIEVQGKTVLFRGRWLWLSAFRDITPHRRVVEELERRVEFEDLVTDISANFINLSPEQADAAIDDALRRIAEFEHVDRSYIYALEGDQMRILNIWARGVDATPYKGRSMPVGDFRWAIEQLERGDDVVYEVVEEHEDGEQPQKRVRSSVCVSMFAAGRLIGYLGFDALREAQSWSDEIVRLLRTVGHVFAATLERKRVQEELDRAYATMEHTVEQRTRELKRKHAQLVHADKMAALGQLVAGVAHEINTPLGAIKSNTDTLSRTTKRLHELAEALPDDGSDAAIAKLKQLLGSSEKINMINTQAVDRIVGIVSSLRQFARLDQAELDSVDLHAAIDNTLILVHHEFKHRVTVQREYGQLPLVECHPDQLNQVFMNLLVNAGQAIEGRGEVHIRTRREGEEVVVEISDSGKGIPPEHRARIFDPGFTTKGVGVGTGLGLSIVHGIVEEHGGRIELTSEVGEGSTFRLRLPIRHAAHSHRPRRSGPEPSG